MENDYGFVDEIFAEGEDIETGISGPDQPAAAVDTPFEALSEAQEADPATEIVQPQEQAAAPSEAPAAPQVDMAKAVGDYSNPNETQDYQGTGEAYDPNQDAAFHALRGLENVTGMQLGSEDYAERQAKGETSAIDSIAQVATRLPTGAALGAVEAVGTTAEIVGDSAREVAQTGAENIGEAAKLVVPDQAEQIDSVLESLATLSGAQESNNPWSSEYDWVKWDLGKDELGQKTPAGKMAQGFAEFGILLAGTGGFNGWGGVGQAMASKATMLGKAGVVAKNAALEGFYGVAADMIAASKGEGNLANLVRESFPALEGSFLTALAVDEDDNPWETMFKTALDGAIPGAGIGAMGAWFAGARAARRAVAAGKPAEEVTKEAFEASQKAYNLYHGTTPSSADLINSTGFRSGATGTNILGGGVYFARDPRYAGMYGETVLQGADTGLNIRKLDRPVLDILDEVGIEYQAFDLETGADVDLKSLTPQQIADDVGYDMTNEAKKRLQEYLSEGGKYDGVEFNPSFAEVLTPDFTASEVLIFDPKVADEVLKGGRPEPVVEAITPKPSLDMSPGIPRAQNLMEGGQFVLPSRFENYSQLMDLEAKGITTTWDDAAAVVPEYFTPGARAVEPSFSQDVLKALDKLGLDEGFTRNPFTGETPTSGVAVAIDGVKLEDFSEDAISTFISQNRTALSREDVYLSAWKSELTGKTVVELSRVVDDPNEARFLGYLFDQEGIFDVGSSGYIPTGGKNRLTGTQFNNLRSPFGQAPEVTTVPAEQAYAQQLQSLPFLEGRAPAQRAVTDAQLEILSRATSDGGEQVLRDFVEQNLISVDDLARQARMSTDDVTRAAGEAIQDALGATGDVDFSKILTQQVGEDVLLSRAGIVQVKGLMTETANAIGDSAFKANTMSQQGIDATQHLVKMTEQLKSLLRIHKTAANAYSKYLSTYKIHVPELGFKLDDLPTTYTVDELAQNIQKTDEFLDNMVKGIQSGDPKQHHEALRVAKQLELFGGDTAKLVGASVKLGDIAKGKLFSVMYNSMLSSPTTHLVNTMSNAFNTVYRPLTALAGGDKQVQKAALASYHNFGTTLSDAWNLAGMSFKLNEPITSGSKMVQESLFTRELAEITQVVADSGSLSEKAAVGAVNLLANLADNPLLSLPSRLLTTSDEFFKTMVTRMEFNRKMMEKAIDNAGIGSDNLKEVFENLLKSEYSRNFTKSGNVLNEDLLKSAKEVTFQTELQGAVKSFATFIDNAPGMRIFFPFVKTGHNIMVYTGTHVPVLNLALEESRSVLLNPNADPYQKAIIKGRMAFSSLIMLTGGIAANQGNITGNGPADPRQRKEWLKTNQPRSIKLPGGYWLSMDRLEPFGQILSAIADIHYSFQSGQLEEDKAKYLAGQLMYSISANLTDRSFLQGLAPLGNLLNPRSSRSLERLAVIPAEVANNFIPASGLRRAISNAMQPFMQEFNGEFDRLINSASAGVVRPGSVSYDYLTGEKIDAPSGGINALLPMKVVRRGQDPVRDKLMDIEFNSSDVIKELGGVKLTAAQITRIQQLMGTETNLYKNLKRLVLNPKFDESLEQYKAELRAGSRVTKENQFFYRKVTEEVRSARDMAIRLLRQEDPELDSTIEEANASARFARTPNGLQDIIDYGN